MSKFLFVRLYFGVRYEFADHIHFMHEWAFKNIDLQNLMG